jgi:5'(3')-deoxyribonucleotidase
VKKLEIALDCDGLLCAFAAGALLIVKEVTGRHYELSDIDSFDITKALGLSDHEADQVWKTISGRRGFVTSLLPYPQARQGVRRLRELGNVFCVTQPYDENPWWRAERTSWLALHFGIDVVHHAEDKTAYPADVFVDDRSKHVRAWSRAWPDGVAVFWRTPHNTTETVPPGTHSIGTWDGLYQVAREAALGPVQRSLPEVAP